jgi:hypothetical protein
MSRAARRQRSVAPPNEDGAIAARHRRTRTQSKPDAQTINEAVIGANKYQTATLSLL